MKILEFYYDPNTGHDNANRHFDDKEVMGITMAPDGTTYANLKDFRQARIRVNDYFNLKERFHAPPIRTHKG